MLADNLRDKENTVIYLEPGKLSWFLTNQSSIRELEGAMHLFSKLPVGIPQAACFAWDYVTR